MNMGLRALRSRRLHYFSTARRLVLVPVSNNRIDASSAAEPHAYAKPCQHVDQRIRAEEVNPTPQ
jgi:hypothetical protein